MINKINPLYILALFVTIFFISYVELDTSKVDLNKKILNHNEFKRDVQEFNILHATWDKKDMLKNINLIATLSNDIKVEKYKSKTILTLQSQEIKLKQNFINKVLNNNLQIEKFDIKKDIIVFEIGMK